MSGWIMISSALVMVAYFVIFAIVHSLLADPGFKSWEKSILGQTFDRWQRLFYNLLALLMVLPFLFILSFLPDRTLYIIPAPYSWFLASAQLLAVATLLIILRQTGISYFLGLSQLQDLSGQANGEGRLVTDGFYCYIRNPLFFFAAIFLWLSPLMTCNLLVFNILATVYFYLGARHEERSLKEEFGHVYEDYKERVPMFLPRLRCSG
ncbi:MAG: isoprenylcysteine carboxylmethyltransferase family protein [Methanothrix sp.]|nr:isoprenylcysteine carboxylmethyltransferase family protein [Methanothrix sp.]MDD4447179.1 isoprenylcysteine carboxylmethyltransferase family protein [Methanothrix sp.]